MQISNLISTMLLLSCFSGMVCGQRIDSDYGIKKLREGDIVFEKIPCGDLCDAIIETTPCKPGRMFNHCGIVHFEMSEPYVIEAIGTKVKQTGLKVFMERDTSQFLFVGRLKEKYKSDIARMIKKSMSYINTPYDNAFLPGDSALYCSELIYESFSRNGHPLFTLRPMTFVSPSTGATYSAWVNYYKSINKNIPEGLPGINPCAIANDNMISLLKIRK